MHTLEKNQMDRALALLAITEIMASGRAPIVADETWRAFISARQSATLTDDEKRALAKRIASMPGTYEADGQGRAAIAHLRYFIPSAGSLGGESRRGVSAGSGPAWYITERDKSADDGDGNAQAFGLADLFADGGEIGYISIPELLENGAHLDLAFVPMSLEQIERERLLDQAARTLYGRAYRDLPDDGAQQDAAATLAGV
jgi:hypothetical protein